MPLSLSIDTDSETLSELYSMLVMVLYGGDIIGDVSILSLVAVTSLSPRWQFGAVGESNKNHSSCDKIYGAVDTAEVIQTPSIGGICFNML